MSAGSRVLGLVALVADAVEHGSRAIERVQIETARRPFALVEAIPPLEAPARLVHAIHDGSIASTHVAIRLAGRLVGAAVAWGCRTAPLLQGDANVESADRAQRAESKGEDNACDRPSSPSTSASGERGEMPRARHNE